MNRAKVYGFQHELHFAARKGRLSLRIPKGGLRFSPLQLAQIFDHTDANSSMTPLKNRNLVEEANDGSISQ